MEGFERPAGMGTSLRHFSAFTLVVIFVLGGVVGPAVHQASHLLAISERGLPETGASADHGLAIVTAPVMMEAQEDLCILCCGISAFLPLPDAHGVRLLSNEVEPGSDTDPSVSTVVRKQSIRAPPIPVTVKTRVG